MPTRVHMCTDVVPGGWARASRAAGGSPHPVRGQRGAFGARTRRQRALLAGHPRWRDVWMYACHACMYTGLSADMRTLLGRPCWCWY